MNFHHLFRSISAKPHLLRPLHAAVLVSGHFSGDPFFPTRLLPIYSRLGQPHATLLTFYHIPNKNIFTWNTLLFCLVQNALFPEAVDAFYGIVRSGLRPDAFTFPAAVKACWEIRDGERMHCWVSKIGVGEDLYVSASLVHMYSRFRVGGCAWKVFVGTTVRDLGLWNAMISGFCQSGWAEDALGLFGEMRVSREGLGMNSVTFSSVIPACAQLGEVSVGLVVHVLAIKLGLESEVYVSNAFIDMYAKLGRVDDARLIFEGMMDKDMVSWNSMISAYEQFGNATTAIDVYGNMKVNGFLPDVLTLVSLSSVIAQLGDDRNARLLHGFVLRKGWDSVHITIGNAVVDMYAKLNSIECARKAFDRLPCKDVISWNTLISGYSQNGLANEAIEMFHMMNKCEGIVANQGTLVGVIPAYSCIGALRQGMQTHGRTIKVGLDLDMFVGTCLMDMYAKCGRLSYSLRLFEQIPRKSLISWNTILANHAVHGRGRVALELFEQMQDERVMPDQVTFLCLLLACSHAGLVDHGKRCFVLMQSKYKIEPIVKHYACMVDMLGRSGDLIGAYELIRTMPMRPDAGVWGALLAACRIHGNVELGKLASNYLFQIDPENVGYYVLLSNMYARVGKWREVDEVRNLVKCQGLKKTPGWSSIELNNEVHVFFTGNQSHPQCREIYEELCSLMNKIKGLGFVPDFSCVLQDVEEDEKEHILISHNERLAIAFGIINTNPKTPIQIFKNLRVCLDCHNATKFISRITEREIIVRDSCRFHHFKDGACSCGDYW